MLYCENNSSMIAVCVYAFKNEVVLKRCCWARPYFSTTIDGFLNMDDAELKSLIETPPLKSVPDKYIAHDLCFVGKCKLEKNPQHIDFVCDFDCNLRCVHCISDFEGSRSIKVESPRNKILKKLFNIGCSFEDITMDANGETFFHYDDLLIFLKSITNKDLKKIFFITNATLLNRERLLELKQISEETGIDYFLRVSIDGCTKETFESVRIGAVFEKVIENAHLIQEIFGKQKLQVEFTCKKQNAHEFPLMSKFIKDEFDIDCWFMSDAFDKDMQKLCANGVSLKDE